MKLEEMKIGKWYLIRQYGLDRYIKGKCTEVFKDGCLLKFYWGGPFRSKNFVDFDRIIEECKRPKLFSNR